MPRIGQILVRDNVTTENSVARALGVQQFAGGRLGTLLLERGSVGEDELGKALARQHGCEYISWQVLGNVPPPTIASLPAKFAVRHAAVPYERGEGFLRVALRDPTDLRILDELFFVTGRKVLPAVVPEVRIYQALEKYYGERRTPRFAILAEKLSRPTSRPASGPLPPPPSFFPDAPSQPASPPPRPREVWGESSESDNAEPSIIQTWKVPDLPTLTWGAPPPGKPDTSSAEESSISWEVPWEDISPPSLWVPGPAAPQETTDSASPFLAPEVQPEEPAAAVPPSPPFSATSRESSGPSPRPSAPERSPMRTPVLPSATGPSATARVPARRQAVRAPSEFPEVLAARERDAIARAALISMARRFPRCAVFAAKPHGVAGWEAAGDGTDPAAIREIEIPWTEPSVFLNVRLSRAFYLGPLPPLSSHTPLATAMGGSAQECLVQPVVIREKPVAFLYAEFAEDQGASPRDLAFARDLASAASTAFAESIRLKKKDVV